MHEQLKAQRRAEIAAKADQRTANAETIAVETDELEKDKTKRDVLSVVKTVSQEAAKSGGGS